MIYTVTLNPSLDYVVSVNAFQTGKTNRTVSEQIVPGGKGLNVSMVLHTLGIPSVILGFTAGFTGEQIEKEMKKKKIPADFIRLEKGFSRINFKLSSIEGTEINGQGPGISKEALDLLKAKTACLKTGDTLVLAGSIPGSVSSSIYRELAETVQGHGVRLAADTTGDSLKEILPLKPFLIKPNHHELGELFGVKIQNQKEAYPYARRLQQMGASNVLVSLAGKGAALLDAKGVWMESPALAGTLVNGVGAGDSMIAGFLAGWEEKRDYRYAFRLAVAAASATAFSSGLAEKKDILRLLSECPDPNTVSYQERSEYGCSSR